MSRNDTAGLLILLVALTIYGCQDTELTKRHIKNYKAPNAMTLTVKEGKNKAESYTRYQNGDLRSSQYLIHSKQLYIKNDGHWQKLNDKQTKQDIIQQIDPKIRFATYSTYMPGKDNIFTWKDVSKHLTVNNSKATSWAKNGALKVNYFWKIKNKDVTSMTMKINEKDTKKGTAQTTVKIENAGKKDTD